MQIEVLGERYQLQDPIGRGGMATIYRGRDMRMDRFVAIKVLREVYSTDPKFVTRFQREAKAASALQHPNIVQVYDYGQSDGNYFIVMELVEGTDLRRYLRSRGVLAMDRAVIIAHDVALGLGAAHRRSIVHRDVKPQNIMVGRDGSIKLTDFGIASVYKDINDERLTTTGMTLGTVQYYAPEQAQGEIVSPAADVYALGIVMYEMVTGRTPFDGDTPVAVAMQHIQDAPVPPSQLNPNIPPALEEIILRCLEKIPEMRFRDGSTLARALELLGEENSETVVQSTNFAPNGGSGPVSASGQVFQPLNGNGAFTSSPNQQPGSGGLGPNSSPDNGAATAFQSDQAYGPISVDPAGAATAIDQQRQVPYSSMGDMDAGETHPFQRDALSSAGGIQGQKSARTTGIVTVLILLATVLLLIFSIYLATQLGFLSFAPKNPHPTPSAAPQTVSVPTLVNLTYPKAQQVTKDQGLNLAASGGKTIGIVTGQSPKAGDTVARGTTINVQMGNAHQVPTDLIGQSLTSAENELKGLGINYTVSPIADAPTGVISNSNAQGIRYVVSEHADAATDDATVTRTDPAAGAALEDNQSITLYVTDSTGPAVTPTDVAPSLPTPIPTLVPPQSTPTPMPTPTPTPTPVPPQSTPTPILLPSPTIPIIFPPGITPTP
jgi:eukaryotic-like serine/threonine-protein kinase